MAEKLNTTQMQTTDAGEIVPLFKEEIEVSKRKVETGRLQVARTTSQREELIDELLAREQVEIERKPIGKPVDAMPPVREEGDTIIVPIVKEVVVVERRLFLKEEVHIHKVHATERYQERVTLRQHEATIKRLPPEEQLAERASAAAGAAEKVKES